MNWLWEHLWGLWILFWLLALVILLLSPFESLGWWSGWNRRGEKPLDEPASGEPREGTFVVYLTGVAGFSGEFLSRRERGFLDRLRERLPDAVIVSDVFPFSATNNPLDGDRLLRALWVWLHHWRLKVPNNVFDLLIIMRNMAQTLVSADPRYGPVYNRGVARQLALALKRAGYARGPVNLVAYSGGAQIAIGAAPYLKEALGCPLRLVSLGGVMTDDPGIRAVDELVDFKGTRDHVMPALGWLLFPGRWRALWFSPWNRARSRMRWECSGAMAHIGGRDYFSQKATGPDGRCHGDISADLVAGVVGVSPF